MPVQSLAWLLFPVFSNNVVFGLFGASAIMSAQRQEVLAKCCHKARGCWAGNHSYIQDDVFYTRSAMRTLSVTEVPLSLFQANKSQECFGHYGSKVEKLHPVALRVALNVSMY